MEATSVIYQRHLSREIIGSTTLVLLAFLVLFGFFDLIAELRDVGRKGYEYRHALGFVALTLPGRAYELLPVCVLIGTLHALNQLARHSEITVLRASGLSTGQFIMTLMRLGIFFALVTVLVGEFVAPPAERLAQQFKLQTTSAMVAREFRSGIWVKDGPSFVNVSDVAPDSSLAGIKIFEFDTSFRLVASTQAERGKYLGDGIWRLESVAETRFDDKGANYRTVPAQDWKSDLTPEILSVLLVDPGRMSMATLYRYVNYLDDNRRKTSIYEVALWKKLVYPFANLVMMLLALPFAFMQDRRGAVSVKVFIGIMLGVGFYMLNGLMGNLTAISDWPPALGAVTPSLVFLLGAVSLLWWTERR